MQVGTKLGAYEIIAKIGEGGMGEVYRARDSRLGRDVALKILPADVAADSSRLARFEHEARTVARLNHPNIVTLFSIEDVGGTRFLTMELIEGRSLDRHIAPGGTPAPQVVEWGVAIADALGSAHAQGIVHRDVKPGNVLLTADGRLKVLDFGLAKQESAADDATQAGLSIPGQVVGTVPYMAPEQVRGENVDPRTDVFALGIVLYELSTGQRPFEGTTFGVISSAILRDTPASLTTIRPDLPTDLVRIVERCLEKDPAARFQSANEVGRELRRVRLGRDAAARQHDETPTQPATAGSTGVSRAMTSLAVLPFANMSADVDNEHFCDGLAEELLNALSKIDALKVAARTSAFSFKGKNVDVGTIARTLGVTSVLDGSIRRSGNRLRISVQLVNAADGYQMWSERYDREMRDVFELQDEITLAVVAALKLRLFGEERAAVLKRYTDNAEAYELFLKGRHHSYEYTAQGWQRAIEFFEKAIALEPDYALAYAGIAASRGCQWFFGILPAEQVIPQCKAASARALALDEGLADAYLSVAMITFFYDWDWRGAERTFIRSIELNPGNGEALSYYALFLAFDGRADEALAAGRKALVLDPLAPLINMNVGWTYVAADRPAEALQQAAKMIESDPDFYGAYWLRGSIHLSAGEYQAAVDQLRSAVSFGGHQVVVADLASACSLAGATGEATAILDRLVDLRRRRYVPAICLARVYSRLGNTTTAIEWLEAAFAERNGEMVFLEQEIAGAADDDPLRQLADEPRVSALFDRMRLPKLGVTDASTQGEI